MRLVRAGCLTWVECLAQVVHSMQPACLTGAAVNVMMTAQVVPLSRDRRRGQFRLERRPWPEGGTAVITTPA